LLIDDKYILLGTNFMPVRLDPDHTYQNTLKHWWKIALFAILGGVFGLLISFLQKPYYEAEAIFHATIDFTKVNAQNLANEDGSPYQFTQYEEDLALLVVQNTLLAQMDEMYAYAQTLDPELDRAEFEANKHIRRHHALWYLRVSHHDPEIARAVANRWAEVGNRDLLYAQVDGTAAPFVRVDRVSEAALPEEPLFRHRNTLMLGGMLLGLIAGVIWVDSRGRSYNLSL
jgi:uncharacterized protein involved in exopolysaccharide biosynthesis